MSRKFKNIQQCLLKPLHLLQLLAHVRRYVSQQVYKIYLKGVVHKFCHNFCLKLNVRNDQLFDDYRKVSVIKPKIFHQHSFQFQK